MTADFDLAVIGSGFGGSLLSMIGRRLGLSVVLLERERHPRFAIGESSTPLANLLLEEIAKRYDLPRLRPLAKWGPWQGAYPEVGCGLKRGFTFFHHELGRRWTGAPERRDQMLVAASLGDRVADTHWYRPDFDQFLVREAQTLGVELLDALQLTGVRLTDSGGELTGQREGRSLTIRARRVVDASGPGGFLHRTLGLPERPFAGFPETQALYAHFRDVRRWDSLHVQPEAPPYPVDDAAVHHVFAGGWIWVLRFNNGITSAGLAAEPGLARTLGLAEGAPAWTRLLALLPSVREQFETASAGVEFRYAPRLPFRSGTVTGKRWALLPSAAGFVDPLLSTGFPLTLLGVERLGRLLEREWEGSEFERELAGYAACTLAELDVAADLVAALYANFADFELFSHLTLLYFAAAMYAETVRRLGRPFDQLRAGSADKLRAGYGEGSGFLMHAHPVFGPALRDCVRRARTHGTAREDLLQALRVAIEPFNLAGLGEPARRNWYPVRADDLLAAGAKLGASAEELERLLAAMAP